MLKFINQKSRKILVVSFLIFVSNFGCNKADSPVPFQATGIKIGEVTDSNAIIWTRLTLNPARVGKEAPIPEVSYRNPETNELQKKPKGRPDWSPVVHFPNGSTIETIEGAVPGSSGEVRIHYKMIDKEEWDITEWKHVDEQRDFTCTFKLTGLASNANYQVNVESRSNVSKKIGQTLAGGFKTAPAQKSAAKVVFTVSTGQAYNDQDCEDGFKIYSEMLKIEPSFFVHTGDILYYDRLAKTLPLARWHWARTYSLPGNVKFHNNVSSYFIKDDHDTWMNDCWPNQKTKFMGDFTFEQGLSVFLEQAPMSEKTYRTFRWGKDLQVWLVEGRDFRSPNTMKDGPDKTIWGKEQKDWFKRTVMESDATFRILISPTPVVGPDREKKKDNHSNKSFQYEGNEIRDFLSKQKNMFVICGDRHWQYVSVDGRTGVREYSCGPASNEHAGGWKNSYLRPEHKYLNVIGGFLAVITDRENGKPVILFRHYGVNGDVLNEDRLTAEL